MSGIKEFDDHLSNSLWTFILSTGVFLIGQIVWSSQLEDAQKEFANSSKDPTTTTTSTSITTNSSTALVVQYWAVKEDYFPDIKKKILQ